MAHRNEIPDWCESPELDEAHVLAAQARVLDTDAAARLARFYAALADPTRVRIIAVLLAHELCVNDLAAALGMTQSAVSHQLRLLRELRLVRARKDGRHVYYTLDDLHVGALFQHGLEHVSHG